MKLRLVALALLSVFLALPAVAAPARWSIERASLGFTASGAVFDREGVRTEAFLPDAYLTYNLTSQMTLAGLVERDFARHTTIGKAGVRFAVYKSEMSGARVYAGANIVGYGDEGATALVSKATSWDAQLGASYPVWTEYSGATRAWGIVQIAHDSQNALTTARIGLRYQLIGGRP